MIFFMQDSEIGVGTLIFYTCIYYPFLQAKRSLLAFIALISCLFRHSLECSNADRYGSSKELTCCSIDLPMERYGDLKNRSASGCCDGDETCSVCLVEFEYEDYVSELSKCGHVFHINCIEKWVERNQFTCPLCRSIFLYSS